MLNDNHNNTRHDQRNNNLNSRKSAMLTQLDKKAYLVLAEVFNRKCTGIKYDKRKNGEVVITISPITIGKINKRLKKKKNEKAH